MASIPCPPDCTNPNYHLHTAPSDPAYALLQDGYKSTPTEGVYNPRCYICTDPEFAQMGMPLCSACKACQDEGRGKGHVPADDEQCSVCGFIMNGEFYPPGVFDLLGRMH